MTGAAGFWQKSGEASETLKKTHLVLHVEGAARGPRVTHAVWEGTAPLLSLGDGRAAARPKTHTDSCQCVQSGLGMGSFPRPSGVLNRNTTPNSHACPLIGLPQRNRKRQQGPEGHDVWPLNKALSTPLGQVRTDLIIRG